MKKRLEFAALGVAVILGLVLGVSTAGAGLIAHYDFDADYTDASGNGNDGSAFDGNTDGDTDGVSITTTAGEYKFGGGAVDFGAERDYVDIPTQTIYSGNEYSVAFWAKRTATNTWDMVIGNPSDNVRFIGLRQDTGNYVRWRGNASANTADFTAAADTAWHHYVVIAEDADSDSSVDDITFYRDASFVGTVNDLATGFIFNAIGAAYSGGDYDMDGQMDEVWIFDEAIDAATVSNLYNNNAVIPEPASVVLLGLAGLLMFVPRRR